MFTFCPIEQQDLILTGRPQTPSPSTEFNEDNVTALLGELDQFTRDWRKLRFDFGGQPPFAESISAWQDAVSRNLILAGDDDVGFSKAWREAVSAVRNLMCYRFVPLACRVLSTFGTPSLVTVPSPPDEMNVAIASFEDKVLTADLFEAGKRIVVWSAAHRYPRELNRSSEHSYKFWLWTGTLLEVFPNFIRADVGVVESLNVLIDHLRVPKTASANQSDSQPDVDTSVFLCVPNESEQSLPRKIRYIDKDKFYVEFDGETGWLEGVGASRFVRLCMHGPVHASVLARDSLSMERSRSVSDESGLEIAGQSNAQSAYEQMSPEDRQSVIAAVNDELEDIEFELAESISETRRKELESKKTQAIQWKNSLHRRPASNLVNAKLAVSKSIQRLADKQCLERMPTFAKAILSSVHFDPLADGFFVNDMGWEFENFDN